MKTKTKIKTFFTSLIIFTALCKIFVPTTALAADENPQVNILVMGNLVNDTAQMEVEIFYIMAKLENTGNHNTIGEIILYSTTHLLGEYTTQEGTYNIEQYFENVEVEYDQMYGLYMQAKTFPLGQLICETPMMVFMHQSQTHSAHFETPAGVPNDIITPITVDGDVFWTVGQGYIPH